MVKTDTHLPWQQEKFNHMAHFTTVQIYSLLSCTGKHCSTLHPSPGACYLLIVLKFDI